MAHAPTKSRPDINEMYAVHGVFRDSLGAAPGLVGKAAPDDKERVTLVANFYENVLWFLAAHHDSEEALVFPLLRARCEGGDELVDRLAGEHEEAMERLRAAQSALAAWPGGDARAQQAAADTLESLRAHLAVHLEDEEIDALPLCAEHLSVEEWGAIPAHAMAHFGGDKIWLIIGLIRERMTDPQRAAMLENMPPPARDMWTGSGARAFMEYSSQIHVPVESVSP